MITDRLNKINSRSAANNYNIKQRSALI